MLYNNQSYSRRYSFYDFVLPVMTWTKWIRIRIYELPDSPSVAVIRIQVTMVPTHDLNLNFSDEDSAAYKIDLMAASSFRNFLYEDIMRNIRYHQLEPWCLRQLCNQTTSPNMPNQARITNTLMAGRKKRWVSFTESAEYRTLLRSFKFNETPEDIPICSILHVFIMRS